MKKLDKISNKRPKIVKHWTMNIIKFSIVRYSFDKIEFEDFFSSRKIDLELYNFERETNELRKRVENERMNKEVVRNEYLTLKIIDDLFCFFFLQGFEKIRRSDEKSNSIGNISTNET